MLLCFGAFGDASPGANGLCDLAADTLAHEHMRFKDCIPGAVKAMYAH